MGEWFASVAESFSKAFLVSSRYMAYLNGFKTTLILSFFAVIVGVVFAFVGKNFQVKVKTDDRKLEEIVND